jgi:serine phosphatase RsbU (regulator of sigma subunit)
MKNEEQMERNRKHDAINMWSRLQTRMTISYVAVTVVTALLLELLIGGTVVVILSGTSILDRVILTTTKHTAQVYALEAALKVEGTALNPRTTFQPGQPASIDLDEGNTKQTIPYIDTQVPYIDPHSPTPKLAAFALLIAPSGQVLASSYPARYPVSTPIAQLLPGQAHFILNALAGRSESMIDSQGRVASAVEPVWSRENKPIGAVYVQVPGVSGGDLFMTFAGGWARSGLGWLLITAPIGAIFGVLTTRRLVRRVHRLVNATAQFANGDYTQHVPVSRQDEIGQLEQQFNQMAQQLVESIAQQQALVEQQARLEERARIEQELRAAQYIQRALLPKDVPTLPGWQLAPFYQPAREVGGDFYDFLPLADGRLGLVIGDATDKGMPAALLMATTCTMLRTAARETVSPGEVLARVNDLLYATVPSGMFATCFYGILDPGSGRLRYVNAGHDCPYLRHCEGVSELRATGMPLGMMPGTCYEEQEAILAPGESVLFFSDGLVEAHNAKRDMFGLPRLMALIGTHPGGSALIDFLLSELASFTGNDEEQEDDVTLVALSHMP